MYTRSTSNRKLKRAREKNSKRMWEEGGKQIEYHSSVMPALQDNSATPLIT